MINQGYYLPVWVFKTSYGSYYLRDQMSNLLYWERNNHLHTIFSKSQFLMIISHLLASSLFLVSNSIRTWEHKVMSPLSISPCCDHELTPSTAFTQYCIQEVFKSSQNRQSFDRSQLLNPQWISSYSILYIPTILS